MIIRSALLLTAMLAFIACPSSNPDPKPEPDRPVRPERCTLQMANACVKEMQACREHYGPANEATFCDQLRVCEIQEIDIQPQVSDESLSIQCRRCEIADHQTYMAWRNFYTAEYDECKE